MKSRITAAAIAVLTLLSLGSSPTRAAGTFLQFEHPAKYVVGDDNFVNISFGFGNDAAKAAPNVLTTFIGGHCFVTPDNKLIVPDRANNRVLIFNTLPTANGPNANMVIGAPDLSTGGNGAGNKTDVDNPFDARTTPSGQFIVVDRNNNRVLIWNTFPTTDYAEADVVLGQKNFTDDNSHADRWGMANPEQCAVFGTKLAVADRENSRILIWNDISAGNVVNGQDPDVVVTGTGDKQMKFPRGVAFGLAGQLVVGGKNQNRVLIFNTTPSADNAEPDIVIGQPNFATTVDANEEANRTAAVLCGEVQGVAVSPTGSLAVADNGRGCVMIWDNFPTASGQPADRILGASSFTGKLDKPGRTETLQDERSLGGRVGGMSWGPNGSLYVLRPGDAFRNCRLSVFDPDHKPQISVYEGPLAFSRKSASVEAGSIVRLNDFLDPKMGIPPFSFTDFAVWNSQLNEWTHPSKLDTSTPGIGIVTAAVVNIHNPADMTPQSFLVQDKSPIMSPTNQFGRGEADSIALIVFPKMDLRADQPAVYPGSQTYINASGGVGTYTGPYVFSFADNRSGGTLEPPQYGGYYYQYVYKAGNTSGITDIIEVADSEGHTARTEIRVSDPPVVSPADPTVDRNGTIQFDFQGGIFPRDIPPDQGARSWMMVENVSGGSINYQTGFYQAGPNGGKDIIALHDVNGYLAKVTVTVFMPAPVISGASNAQGQQSGGQVFTITGQNFDQPVTATVGGINATVQYVNGTATEIMVLAPPSDSFGPKDIVVTTGGGSATLAGGFEYLPAPTIASIWPDKGPKAGGNQATIYGANLKGATAVYIGYTMASNISVFEDGNSVSFTVPPGYSTTAQNISVTTPGGTAGKYSAYTYISPPSISYFTPYSAPVGTTIAISGSRLSTTSGVTFNGIRADFTVISNSKVNARVPAGATTGPVVVTTTGGTATRNFTVTQ